MPSVGEDSTSLSALTEWPAGAALDPIAAISGALDRLERTEPEIRAWVHVDQDGALRAARLLETSASDGPLKGVPFGVKDIIDMRGLPTECGSPLRRGCTASRDAPLVARLRELGAIPLGKTVTTEFAYFAPGPTRNPRDLARTPGGSSSGSAAAVAAGVVPLALGSQTAGSLTRPAAYCGIAGFVAPVGGALSTAGFVGLSHSLDAVGLLTPTVAGLRLVHGSLTGQGRLSGPPAKPRQVKLAVWSGDELGEVDAAMREALERAVGRARADGVDVTVLDWTDRTPRLVEAHHSVMSYEAARALSAESGRPDLLSAPLNDLLAHGRGVAPTEYRNALDVARKARHDMHSLLGDFDAVLGPAALGAAPSGLTATGSPVLSRPWQLLGLPVVVVPGHQDSAGLPLGLQLIGHPDRLSPLFALAHDLEQQAMDRSETQP
ncbi:amidase [Streptomyces sp. NPDC088124]|uniref:amidase n=1 Tax=Streptomyces sp. NPDC088124 TaxID=3154654 RepID=UPI003431072A